MRGRRSTYALRYRIGAPAVHLDYCLFAPFSTETTRCLLSVYDPLGARVSLSQSRQEETPLIVVDEEEEDEAAAAAAAEEEEILPVHGPLPPDAGTTPRSGRGRPKARNTPHAGATIQHRPTSTRQPNAARMWLLPFVVIAAPRRSRENGPPPPPPPRRRSNQAEPRRALEPRETRTIPLSQGRERERERGEGRKGRDPSPSRPSSHVFDLAAAPDRSRPFPAVVPPAAPRRSLRPSFLFAGVRRTPHTRRDGRHGHAVASSGSCSCVQDDSQQPISLHVLCPPGAPPPPRCAARPKVEWPGSSLDPWSSIAFQSNRRHGTQNEPNAQTYEAANKYSTRPYDLCLDSSRYRSPRLPTETDARVGPW